MTTTEQLQADLVTAQFAEANAEAEYKIARRNMDAKREAWFSSMDVSVMALNRLLKVEKEAIQTKL